jgi:hypothetical protein
MSDRKKPIRLTPDLDRLLRNLYVQLRIPRDQYKKRPEDAVFLERAWRNLTGRDDPWQELVRYMQNQQKAKERLIARGLEPWPVFDGNHRRAPALAQTLDDNEMTALKAAYEAVVLPLALGTDAAMWHEQVVKELEREFAKIAGRIVPGLLLLAIAEEKRKRGLWFHIGTGRRSAAFSDIDQIDKLRKAEDDES